MVNVSKIRTLSTEKGIKLTFIIEQLGLKSRTYFQDLEKRHGDISDDRLLLISEILDTSPEYLRDEIDDPSPKQKKPALTESQIDLDEIDPVKADLIKSVMSMKREDVEKISQFFDLLKKS